MYMSNVEMKSSKFILKSSHSQLTLLCPLHVVGPTGQLSDHPGREANIVMLIGVVIFVGSCYFNFCGVVFISSIQKILGWTYG